MTEGDAGRRSEPEFLLHGDGPATVLLAPGAGAPARSAFLNLFAGELAGAGIRVARFDFAYMAARATGGGRRPPPKMEVLCGEYRAAVAALAERGPLVIGGKSMGGRVASLVADELFSSGKIAGLLCLSYPFHPAGKPESLRTAHLETLRVPTLICQGTRDPLGGREEVGGYGLSDRIDVFWLEDGDHDLKPRKSLTGASHEAWIARAAARAGSWVLGLGGQPDG